MQKLITTQYAILHMLCELMKYTRIKIDKDFLKSYDKMNDLLIENL